MVGTASGNAGVAGGNGRLEFRVLGPVQVLRDGEPVKLGGVRQRTLLALLLMRVNELVTTTRLVEELFGERASASGVSAVRVAVSRLRIALDGGDERRALDTGLGGYVLRAAPDQIDVTQFERLLAEGRGLLAAQKPDAAASRLRSGLELWRGPPMADIAGVESLQSEIRRLEELRLQATIERIDADLALGAGPELVGELEALVAANPLQERLREQLMRALYRSGRQSDALEVYRETSGLLRGELGLEPSRALQELERSILVQDEALEPRPPAGRGRLPVLPTPTIGRQHEVESVSLLLRSPDVRLVTLVGPGGVGKTRLGGTVASELQGQFAQGAVWVELGGVARAEDVPFAVGQALSLSALPDEDLRDALRRFLSNRELLLVLDNFEHVLGAATLVSELLSTCPELTVLATSREGLEIAAEHRFDVDPLAVPSLPSKATLAEVQNTDGTAMFIAAANRHDRRFAVTDDDASAVARLCARLDGLPLALELAAARTALLGVEELAARLDTELSGLGSGPRDAPPRQRTLQATIHWSYRLLDDDAARAFRRFAVFAGGATIDAAEGITGAAMETIEALIAKSLLGRRRRSDGSTRLVMLETVRRYALEQLAADPDRDGVRRTQCEYYLDVVEVEVAKLWTRDEDAALAVLDPEVDNIRGALTWALDRAPDLALRLAGFAAEYWWIQQDPEGELWLDLAIEAADEQAAIGDLARAHLRRSFLRLLDIDERMKAAVLAQRLYEQIDDHAGMSLANCSLAAGARLRGNRGHARAYAEAACRHARAAGDDMALGWALSRLGQTLEPDEGRATLAEAAELLERLGNHRELASAYSNVGYVALVQGRTDDALEFLDVAVAAAQKVGDPYTLMIVSGNVGLASLFAGDLERAENAFRRTLELCVGQTFSFGADEGLAGLSAIAAQQGLDERAARLAGAARKLGHNEASDPAIVNRLEHDFLDAAIARLGRDSWRRAHDEGIALSYDEAIAYALDDRVSTDRGEPVH